MIRHYVPTFYVIEDDFFNSNFLSIQTNETKMRQDLLGKESS